MSKHTDTNHGHDDHHVTQPGTLFATMILLAVLMGLTILVYKVDFGHMLSGGNDALGSWINNIIALAIAMVKATMVVLVFMGVKWGTKLIKLYALLGFFFFPFLLITFGDYMTRSWEPVQGWTPPSKIHGRFPDEAALPSELKIPKAGEPTESLPQPESH
ncbi:MAG: cytochrome C oxidase subunit IV family protein [Methanoregulaceae archaeon]|jgi:cytochrome c oxidase subunit 4|nr:cytochrome C oxidase subunit IV family protein [Methanoregulaceae archaeon]